ncbi:MAG: hypothetical protein C5B47_00250 [Verrucomicrobia bacterium]|nr:MAG: hypothetical protein C5B47_00250 [Verrucomicrobiota bacterium]
MKMEVLILTVIGAIAALAFATKKSVTVIDASGDTVITRHNKWNLPDIDQENQHGVFSREFDEAFEKASGETGVPFALIKAHAIRESSLKPNAYHFDNATVGASYGLMQVEWIAGSGRFEKYGVMDDEIRDGSLLYDPEVSARLGALIIRDNLDWLKGNLRDAINAYNTGTREAKMPAPYNYVNDVLKYYSEIIGGEVL